MGVHPDAAEVQVPAESQDTLVVGCPDGRGQGVVHTVGQSQGLVVGGELLNGQDRPEDLLLHECVVLLET